MEATNEMIPPIPPVNNIKEEDKNLTKIPMELIYSYKEVPSNDSEPPQIFCKCELVTHDVDFRIPTSACIYFEDKIFTFDSLQKDENNKYDREKDKKYEKYFTKRVNKTSLEKSICDAEKAFEDFKLKKNFTVIYGCRPCCYGYLATKLCFDFPNNSVNIEQQCTCSCNYFMNTYDIHTYTIHDNIETLSLLVNTVLEYLKNHRSESCTHAADIGDLEWLKYAHEKGYSWNKFTCSNTAYNGHLECLKYLHENGCPWDEKTCENAASQGHLDCLMYAIKNECPYDEEIMRWTAGNGHLDCLKYLHENVGCKFHEKTTFAAAQYGHLECLKYAVENGASKHPQTCRMALGNCKGNDCYNYAIQNGFPE